MILQGIVTGAQIAKINDSDKDSVILQVQVLDEDVRPVEVISNHGEDVYPANGCKVIFDDENIGHNVTIVISDGLEPEVAVGEKEIYSTNNPVTAKRARIKLGADSVITINQGTDFAVRYSELETAFNQLKSDFDAHTHQYNPGPGAAAPTGAPVASTADITGAKVDEVKLP